MINVVRSKEALFFELQLGAPGVTDEQLIDAMLAWFLQRFLIASGMAVELLPHPEMLDAAKDMLENPPSPWEAEQDIREVEEFARCVKGYVEERLALDAMCLSITEKR